MCDVDGCAGYDARPGAGSLSVYVYKYVCACGMYLRHGERQATVFEHLGLSRAVRTPPGRAFG